MARTVIILRLSVAHLFDSRCFVCHKKIGKAKGFTYHHLEYPAGEKTYKDFTSQLEYYRYLVPIIRAHPERFMLLCRPHHTVLERLHALKPANLERLIRAVQKTKT